MADQWGERLPRTLGLFNAITILIGVAIGSGIFRVPATVADKLHDPRLILLCWVLGGVIVLCGALTLGELAAALPRSGGIFAYLLESFGPLPAFVFGWTELVVIRASALGATATIFAEYLGYFVPLSAAEVRYVAAAAIVVIGAINYLGAQRAAAVMSVATSAKYAALLVLGLLAYTAASGSFAHFHSGATARGPIGSGGLALLAAALVPVMWTYDGWADLSFMGGEVRNPQRTLPLALALGTACVVAAYLIANVGFLYLFAPDQMGGMKLIAAEAAERIPLLAGFGAKLVAAIVVVSAFSGLNGSMMTGPRIFFAMADQGLFFKAVARVSPRFQSPSVAIWLATALGVAYVLENDFAELADRFVLGIWPFYALAVAGVFVLRRTRPQLTRPYRVPGFPWVPGLFLLASVGLIGGSLWSDPGNTGVTFAIIAGGIPLYYLWKRWNNMGHARP
ncbi:MAG TPA: amino acid permease [Steroidobacteraceae bacterium]|jgi:amino acid transporter